MAESGGDAHIQVPDSMPWSKELQEAVQSKGADFPVFGTRFMASMDAMDKFPSDSKPAKVVRQIIRDDRYLDANPRQDMASFVTTWMEPEANDIMMESIAINYIDEVEYPSTTQIQNTCVKMLADLFHAEEACGTGTVGSSEAILLAGLALKRRWSERLEKAGKDPRNFTPNLVCSSTAHVCWEKLCNYFSVEPRMVHITEDSFVVAPEKLAAACDENTIGVAVILGTTFTGHIEDVKGVDAAIGKLNKEKGWEIGIHVDGASGGFILPFLHPKLEWDFVLPNVVSINASGHKFGLVYAGIGWLIFRSKKFLPESLIFHENYLGADQANFTLNFSKGAMQILGQYYMFLRLGRTGYTQIIRSCHVVAMALAKGLEDTGHWTIYSARDPEPCVPLVAFSLKKHKLETGYDEFDVMARMEKHGWVIPAYTLAPDAQAIRVMRIVCRMDFPLRQAHALLNHMAETLEYLDSHFILTKEEVDHLKQQKGTWDDVHGRVKSRGQLKQGDVDVQRTHHKVPHKGGHVRVNKHGGVC